MFLPLLFLLFFSLLLLHQSLRGHWRSCWLVLHPGWLTTTCRRCYRWRRLTRRRLAWLLFIFHPCRYCFWGTWWRWLLSWGLNWGIYNWSGRLSCCGLWCILWRWRLFYFVLHPSGWGSRWLRWLNSLISLCLLLPCIFCHDQISTLLFNKIYKSFIYYKISQPNIPLLASFIFQLEVFGGFALQNTDFKA